MKKLSAVLATLVLFLGCLGIVAQPEAQAMPLTEFMGQSSPVLGAVIYRNKADAKLGTEFGKKVDLNNSDVRDFRKFRGFYPSLAGKIVKYSPFEKVEDVLNIPGLSESQQKQLQANLDKFTVTPPSEMFNGEDNRYNMGVY
ncbi:MAG: photosystem II complex extrinsic protein PsbU [Prochloron sp. SP5CPC1]|nr:photosystem II complex extrinsic protein PsbU [Candidatus Paraprochloron terpiosi SP5CPC1]